MHRSFLAALSVHEPDIIFILGDVFDEGQWAPDDDFQEYLLTFRQLFEPGVSPVNGKPIPLYAVVGNHDIGFHYRIWEPHRRRFEKSLGMPPVKLVRFRGLIFVLINSMAMEGDGCNMCSLAERKLRKLSERLRCSLADDKNNATSCADPIMPVSPAILLQHFPTYRESESECPGDEYDTAPLQIRGKKFRERWDCLSKSATEKLLKWIQPRAIFGAHSHHGCYRRHTDGTPEWTVASFSWRNRRNPNFLMATITPDELQVYKCYLPNEAFVVLFYLFGTIANILLCTRIPARLFRFLKSLSKRDWLLRASEQSGGHAHVA